MIANIVRQKIALMKDQKIGMFRTANENNQCEHCSGEECINKEVLEDTDRCDYAERSFDKDGDKSIVRCYEIEMKAVK